METKTYYKSRGEHLATRTEKGSTWKTNNKQPVKKTKEINGRPLPYMVIEDIDQTEVTNGFNITDFTIENLEEIGTTKQLPITYAQLGELQIIDKLEQGAGLELERMDAEEWAKKYLQKQQQQEPTKKTEE